MNRISFLVMYLMIAFFVHLPGILSAQFITVEGNRFMKGEEPYFVCGTNFWFGSYLGAEEPVGDKDCLMRELDLLKEIGVNNLRVMALSEAHNFDRALRPAIQEKPGELNEDILKGLDYLLTEMAKRDLQAVLYLGNYWEWSGGFSFYTGQTTGEEMVDPAATGKWSEYMGGVAKFYSDEKAVAMYYGAMKQVITRTNSITNQPYVDDETIMSWELANEPRPGTPQQPNVKDFIKWVGESAAYIKSLDKNHLITTGSEGTAGSIEREDVFFDAHKAKDVDYLTFHMWPKNWGWLDPSKSKETYPSTLEKADAYIDLHIKLAEQLNKPIILEEFGIERDGGDYSMSNTTKWRDKFFKYTMKRIEREAQSGKPLVGSNFWAWGGYGRSAQLDYYWKQGDPYTGDPPQEPQGLNAVFDEDKSTLKVLSKHFKKMKAIK